jgi:hypothetical protein
VIAMFLQLGTMSPISLMELGLHAKDRKLVVCCPEGFWRRGNVQVVCAEFGIPLVETREELAELVKKRLENIIEEGEGITRDSWFSFAQCRRVLAMLISFWG